MIFRILSLAAALSPALFIQSAAAQSPLPSAVPDSLSGASNSVSLNSSTSTAEIKPDPADPGVMRARQNVDRIRGLVQQGVLPPASLTKAQEDLQDAIDMSILRFSALTQDLTPEQADQMVAVAQRMLIRREKRVVQAERLAASGVISRAEAESSGMDVTSAQLAFDIARQRARSVQDLAEALRTQKALAEAETDAESHPEWNGKLYTRYDGSGVFTRADFDKLSAAFIHQFGRIIPVSADGQTAVHRALGFNHTGRIDIALTPDQPEGAWLIGYLRKNRIPYFAFRTAIARKATGAHIHLGPESTRLVAALR